MNLRHLLLPIITLCIGLTSYAQIENPVNWSFETKMLDNGNQQLLFKATIEEDWHMYSQNLGRDDGPIATSFEIEKNNNVEFIGSVQEPTPHKEYDPNFQMDLAYFDTQVTFTQEVKVNAATTIKGGLEFMVCDATKCLPPEWIEYEFKVAPAKAAAKEETIEEKPADVSPNQGILTPVTWSFDKKQLNDSTYELSFKAKIDDNWHLYSQHLTGDGPVPTSFMFEENSDISLAGAVAESKNVHTAYDPNFDMELSFFEKEATFTQKVVVSSKTGTLKGELTYMVCDDSKCLPPDYVPFEFELTNPSATASVKTGATEPANKEKGSDRSLLAIFFLSFLSGFAALLTPCVFPMIPMTVSFFTKQSKTKAKGITNALFYGISIIVIYVILGTVVTAVFGSDALNALSTNVYFNIFFFVLLVVFAISFMGAFEITLPNSWVNKSAQAEDKGGFVGIFFMAFTLALVSFSCTGPIVGTLLVEAASIGGSGPVIGMLGFSMALALPFGLFAAFPGWMNSLPQSGGWLNTVKVFLGFLELALAFKFLSNADLVVQAHYLERELFLAIWIAVFLGLALYLFGVIQLPHDSPLEKISVGRALLATLTLTFVIYLIPGLWGAPLKLISGFPPPMSYSESPQGVGKGGGGSSAESHSSIEGTHLGPQNLPVFHDLEPGLTYAKKIGKPAFLDFTGHACVNCRKMEENVWGEAGVIDILQDDVVVISLYVDDKRELPKSEQKEVKIGDKTKKLRTIGNKWSYIQASKYLTNTQPYYRMLGPNGEDLDNGSADYEHHGNVDDFKSWLEEGLTLYNKAK